MKLPRDISAQELIKSLQKLGYVISRQKGSHIRLKTLSNGEHNITVPNHNPVKLGTLSSILGDVANHFKQTKEEIADKLFG
jgi:predicted RNA binding protein YcfA (HicA-like mRNA interferase family)